MLVIKRFSERKKVFRERKKTGKIRAKRGKRMRLVKHGLEECEFENTCNNDKSLSEIQLEHEKEDELVVVVVKVMVVKEIEDGILEEIEAHGFALWPSCEDFPTGHPSQYYFHMSTLNCQFLGTPLAQDIDGENEDDNENKLVMVNEEGWMS
ncbi:hypothetical protein Tco_0492342 [Tanacetum coccineum]